jgi:hypothetical protein
MTKKKRHLPRRSKVTGRFIKSRRKKAPTKRRSTRTSRRNRQLRAIKTYTKKGYSANKIAKNLKKRNLGMRRKTLLKHVRETRQKTPREHPEKYTPHKYRRQAHISYPPLFPPKRVTLRGSQRGQPKVVRKEDSGRNLHYWVRGQIASGVWDSRPKIES